jgi:hypothetical protein
VTQVKSLGIDEEAMLARHISEEIADLLASYPTTFEHDTRMLSQLGDSEETEVGRIMSGGDTFSVLLPQPDEECSSAAQESHFRSQSSEVGQHGVSGWYARQHAVLAVQYRLSRKLLLERVMHDLELQAKFLLAPEEWTKSA